MLFTAKLAYEPVCKGGGMGGGWFGRGQGHRKFCRVGLAPARSGGWFSFSAHANAPAYGEFQSEGDGEERANIYREETARQWSFIFYKRLIL